MHAFELHFAFSAFPQTRKNTKFRDTPNYHSFIHQSFKTTLSGIVISTNSCQVTMHVFEASSGRSRLYFQYG